MLACPAKEHSPNQVTVSDELGTVTAVVRGNSSVGTQRLNFIHLHTVLKKSELRQPSRDKPQPWPSYSLEQEPAKPQACVGAAQQPALGEAGKHLHSDNIFDIEVFQGSGVGVLPFVTLDDDLLHDPVEQQPVLDSVAASFIWREGRGESEGRSREAAATPREEMWSAKPLAATGFLACPGTHKAFGDSGAG